MTEFTMALSWDWSVWPQVTVRVQRRRGGPVPQPGLDGLDVGPMGDQQAREAMVQSTGGTPAQIRSHPIKFGSGDWTCVVGEFENGSRMVTVAKWRDGAIAEEYIWM